MFYSNENVLLQKNENMIQQILAGLWSNGLSFKEIGVASMVLFAVIDIVGNIPLIIALKEKTGKIYPMRTAGASLFILVGFLFVGESILGLIGVGINEFAVAGSFVLFFMALEMILGITLYKDDISETASIVPLAFPLIAGAGSMTSLLSLRAEYHVLNIILAILINILFVYMVLKSSKYLSRILGRSGINIIRKVFGIILLAIAVKLFTSNIGQLI